VIVARKNKACAWWWSRRCGSRTLTPKMEARKLEVQQGCFQSSRLLLCFLASDLHRKTTKTVSGLSQVSCGTMDGSADSRSSHCTVLTSLFRCGDEHQARQGGSLIVTPKHTFPDLSYGRRSKVNNSAVREDKDSKRRSNSAV
jgi:hypothetical protein